MRQFDKRFMLPVERIVRPVEAQRVVKMRMREELYSHLEQIYLEEFHAGHDERHALDLAVTRLGKPHHLSDELQQTICKRERLVTKYNTLFSRRVDESRIRYAARMGISHALIQMAAYMIPVLIGSQFSTEKSLLTIAPLLIVISLLTGWNTFLGLYISQAFLEPEAIIKNRKRGLTLAGGLFGVSLAVSVVLMWMSIPGFVDQLQIVSAMTGLAFFAGWGMFCLVTYLTRVEKRETVPWDYLELT